MLAPPLLPHAAYSLSLPLCSTVSARSPRLLA